MPRRLTDPKESATRKRVDLILNNLKWRTDESSPSCNVFTERPKTVEQKRALKGNEPDYVLYRSDTNTPIAIVEAKRSGQSLRKALDQAIRLYAEPLSVNIIFVADGSRCSAKPTICFARKDCGKASRDSQNFPICCS